HQDALSRGTRSHGPKGDEPCPILASVGCGLLHRRATAATPPHFPLSFTSRLRYTYILTTLLILQRSPACRSTHGGLAMNFEEILDHATAMLQRRGRVTYRTLQLQSQPADDPRSALKDELLFAHPQVHDEAGRGLIWTGAPGTAASAASAPAATPAQEPLAYTPPYLAEKILTSKSA